MIDFKNGSFIKMKNVDNSVAAEKVAPLLVEGETIISSYKDIRDLVVFTDKRLIAVNVKGLMGRKIDYTTLPYKKITCYSIETAGTFDIDTELELYYSGVGKVKFEFSGATDIVQIGTLISSSMLE